VSVRAGTHDAKSCSKQSQHIHSFAMPAPAVRRVSLRASFSEAATLLQKQRWLSKAKRLRSFDKMPLGPVANRKRRDQRAATAVPSNPVLTLVGSMLFQVSYLLCWVVAPLPWQLPVMFLRRMNQQDAEIARSRMKARYLLAAGYALNWTIGMLALHYSGSTLASAYVGDEYQPRTVFAQTFSGGFCISMSVLCCLQISLPELCTTLITPFVTGHILVESTWKNDLIEELHQLIDRAKPAKLKKGEEAARRQSTLHRRALSNEGSEAKGNLHNIVDSSIWLFPLLSSMVGFGVYTIVHWYVAEAQPHMLCTSMPTTTIRFATDNSSDSVGTPLSTCQPPRFPSIHNDLCCGVVDMTSSLDRFIPTLGGYLGAGFGLMCSVGTLMLKWQLSELNRQIAKLLRHNRGVVDSAKATSSDHARVAQLDSTVQQVRRARTSLSSSTIVNLRSHYAPTLQSHAAPGGCLFRTLFASCSRRCKPR
jgi:hypothetical protein